MSQLVGLGETAREFETKWNRKIEQFYPDYTQKSQKLAEFEKKEQERLNADLTARAEAGKLTDEENRQLAREQARGLGLVVKEDFEEAVGKAVNAALASRDILKDAQSVVTNAETEGKPKTTVDALLDYMDGKNPTNTRYSQPFKAYKDMFEDELGKWKESKLDGLKQPGLDTQTGSSMKQPPAPQPISKDALGQAIGDFLKTRAGSEGR